MLRACGAQKTEMNRAGLGKVFGLEWDGQSCDDGLWPTRSVVSRPVSRAICAQVSPYSRVEACCVSCACGKTRQWTGIADLLFKSTVLHPAAHWVIVNNPASKVQGANEPTPHAGGG